MNAQRKSSKYFWVVTVMLLVLLGFIMSCTNSITDDETSRFSANVEKYTYKMNVHDYIVYEYTKKYDDSHYEKVIAENLSKFKENRSFEIDYDAMTEFIIDNFHLFFDNELYEEIVREASKRFDTPCLIDNFDTFFEEVKNEFLDYHSEFGGVNILQFDEAKAYDQLKQYYSNNILPEMSDYEARHFTSFMEMAFNNSSRNSIVTYLISTINDPNFSPAYITGLEFAINTFQFYEIYLPDTPLLLPATDIVYDYSLYYAYRYLCIDCTGPAMYKTLREPEHLAMIITSSSLGSKVAGTVAKIIEVIKSFF